MLINKTIDLETLEYLLRMEEGPRLDFKREQYRFIGEDDHVKGELLKDILAFANTPRDHTAYILIGVEEVKGGRSKVVGIETPLEDANLHQFVNHKTNKPVEFCYSPHSIDGKIVEIISIPIQDRPVYIEKNYGRLKANVVYIRDGSSTREASPSEIAAMGRGNPPKFLVEWGDATRGIVYPPDYVHTSTFLRLPDQYQSWDGTTGHYDFEGLAQELGVDPTVYDGGGFTTVRHRSMQKPLGLRFHNNSGSVGENVGFTGTLEAGLAAGFGSGTSLNNRSPNRGEIKVGRGGDGIQISVEVGHIRPGDYVWAGATFWTKETGQLMWKVRFVADNLPEPIEYEIPLRVEYKKRYIQAKDLEPLYKRPDSRMLPYVE